MRTVDWFYAFALAGILIVALFSLYGLSELKRHLRELIAALTRSVQQVKDDPPSGAAAILAAAGLLLFGSVVNLASFEVSTMPDKPAAVKTHADLVKLEQKIESRYKARDYDAVLATCEELLAANCGRCGFAYHYRALVARHRGDMGTFYHELHVGARLNFPASMALLGAYPANG